MRSRWPVPISLAASVRLAALALATAVVVGACGDRAAERASGVSSTAYDQDGRLHRPGPRSGEARPNLVVVVIDTLRADAVRKRDGTDGVMPYLASLARKGVLFENAAAPAPWTIPSLTSLLTGLPPGVHGCVDERAPQIRVPDSVTTFAEVLRNSYGYQTAAFVGGRWSKEVDTGFQGFDVLEEDFHLQAAALRLPEWYRTTEPTRPFFLLLHTFEAHGPYGAKNHAWPPPLASDIFADGDPVARLAQPVQALDATRGYFLDRRFHDALLSPLHMQLFERDVLGYITSGYRAQPRPEFAAELRDAYLDGVAWVDGQLRRTVEQLRGWGLLENTILAVTADHGEAFGEHGILMHGRQVYDELVNVPLVMVGPAPFQGGRTVRGSVGLVDVLPTFLDAAGMVPLDGIEATSFLDLAVADGPGRPVTCEELVTPQKTAGAQSALVQCVRTERWKFILTYDLMEGRVREEAYDLERDPGEREDLAAGTGRIATLPFGQDFCDAVEAARDRIWGAVDRTRRMAGSGYTQGVARVREERPPRACVADAAERR